MKKILMVEDDKPSQLYLGLTIKKIMKCEYILDIADDYNSAIKLIQEKEFGYALLDYRIPGGNGLDLCSLIRERNKDNNFYTRVALTTAQKELKELSLYCIDEFFTKPLSMTSIHKFFMDENCNCLESKL